MNLVKWLRKNNTKIMAVVVIVLMIGFIGGSSLTYLLRGRGPSNRTIAYYGDDIKIRQYDLFEAQQDMEILKMLQANRILQALTVPFYQTPDFHSLVLGELLFSEQRPSPQIIAYIQQAAANYQFRINAREIDDLYKRTAPSYYYWYVLNKEAQGAGFEVSNDDMRTLLNQAISQLFGGDYSQTIGNIMKANVLSEDRILTAFGRLMAILRYSHAVCSGQDVTIQQLKHTAAWQDEGLDIEFVKFDSEKFAKSQAPPTEEQMTQQFEKYRQFFPSEITGDNPYGFGYKLPDRVQLQYMTIKLDDIKKVLTEPTFDELEAYYSNNKDTEFIEQVPSDPNDPNSPLISRTKPFSEVADSIVETLMQEEVNSKALGIIQEARTLADSSLADVNDEELDKLSIEDREELAGSYEKVAEDLSSKYKIHIYEGTTGELSATDIQGDEYLSTLYMQGYVNPLGLARVVFAVDKFNVTELAPYETIRSRIYLSLGPVRDSSGKLMALVRVVKALKASVPEDINQQFSTKSFTFDPNEQDTEEKVFSVREKVEKDLKRLLAMDTTKDRAEEFMKLTSEEGQTWESAVDKFNELYTESEPNDVNDSNLSHPDTAIDANEALFELQNLTSLRRLSSENLYTLSLLTENNPASRAIDRERKKGALFLDLLFSLAPEPNDVNTPEFKPQAVEFKPDMSYYAIKNISVTPFWKENYEQNKAISSYTEDHIESQSLALAQFNPANIFERMNFRFAEETKESAEVEPNEPNE